MKNKRNRKKKRGMKGGTVKTGENLKKQSEKEPMRDSPSSEWMRFFYGCFWVELQRVEMQYYCKSFLVMLVEVTLFMAYVVLMVCFWMLSKEPWDILFFSILIIIVCALGGWGLCFLYKLNHKLTEYREKKNQENYFQGCKNQAYKGNMNASEFEFPEYKPCEISHKCLWVIWGVLFVVAIAIVICKSNLC